MTVNCHTVHPPAFFLLIKCGHYNSTYFVLPFFFFPIKKTHYLKSRLKVIHDKYHWNWKSRTGTYLQGSKHNYYFLLLWLNKGYFVYIESFKRLWLHLIVQQKYSFTWDLLQKLMICSYSKSVSMYNTALTFKLHLVSGTCWTAVPAEHFQVFW